LSSIIVDGIAESAYGCPVAVQQIATGYGNSIGTNLMSNGGGSELDAAYGLVKDGVLFLTFAGNLENNFNKLSIFFMTGPGGQNTLTNVNPGVDSGGLNNMGATTNGVNPGLTFDPGFAANYWVSVTGGGTPYNSSPTTPNCGRAAQTAVDWPRMVISWDRRARPMARFPLARIHS